jgi:hypothetical protein
VVERCVVGYRFIVDIVHAGGVHVIHGTVVIEGAMIPISALVANATIAEAIIHASVEADMITPVAAMPDIRIIAPTPITGSPEEANFRGHHPGSRNPEVAFISISPIAGSP